jgi:quinol monooxygenase YgiN
VLKNRRDAPFSGIDARGRMGIRCCHSTRVNTTSRTLRGIPFTSFAKKGALPMYTRVVEFNTKPGKARELCETINDKAVPILKKQAGFVDETVLSSDTESNRVLGQSFWNSKQDAERYHREQYPKIHEMLKHLLESEPVIRTFDVQSSTIHKIVAGKAA